MEGKMDLEPELRGSGAPWEAAHHRKVALPKSATRGQNVHGRPGSESQPGGMNILFQQLFQQLLQDGVTGLGPGVNS